MKSPTSRSLEYLKNNGYNAQVVEYWNPFARKRKDLFGFIDIVALKDTETYGIQVTSASNISARIKKITESLNLPWLREANWNIIVHGWKKNKSGKYELIERDIS